MATHHKPPHRIEYIPEADALLIRFRRPKLIVLDHAEGSEQGVCIGFDPKTGRVRMLSVLRYRAENRHESDSLRTFLEGFGVTIPGDLVRRMKR